MDRVLAMTTFVAIANAASLTAAAKALGEPLTTVSRRLQQLEAQLGTALVLRTTRQMTLTLAGHRYLEGCKRLLIEIETLDNGISAAGPVFEGRLTVTAPLGFGRMHVAPVLGQFLAMHPGVRARLTFDDHNLDLAKTTTDVAVRIGTLKDISLVGRKVGAVGIVTCASPAYLAQHGAPLGPRDLAAHHCITFSPLDRPQRWVFKAKKRKPLSVRVTPRLEVNSADAAIEAACDGLGITRVLSYQAERHLARGALVSVLEGSDETALPIHVLQPPGRHPRALVTRFTEFTARALRHRLA